MNRFTLHKGGAAPAMEPSAAAQLTLFSDQVSEAEAALRRSALALVQGGSSSAANTDLAFRSDWALFSAWCANHRRVALPASEETLLLWLASCSNSVTLATAQRRLWAIRRAHREADQLHRASTPAVRSLLRGLAKTKGQASKPKAALSLDQLRQIAARPAVGVADIRGRAALLLGFATGMRRSELAALEWSDVSLSDSGAVLTIRKSKTDQTGHGRRVGVAPGSAPTCPLAALKAWLDVRGAGPGPLFCALDGGHRLRPGVSSGTGRWIAEYLQAEVSRIGLDPAAYAAHSLRSGLVTAALRAGRQESVIMATTGHRSRAMIARYYHSDPRIDGAAAGLL